jgi:cytochrome bd ubiquinol oxidase subunit I
MNDLLAARSQMAMSLAFHILFAVAGMAMPALMAIATGPLLVVPDVSFASVAAPTAVIIAFAIGSALLLPALVLLYRTFSRRGRARLT